MPSVGPDTAKRYWRPSRSGVESLPNALMVSHEQPGIMSMPHWHAQVELNYVFRGDMEYRMHGHMVRLKAGDLCLFWGGQPHQVIDTSADAWFTAIHMPLVNFFRLRLAPGLIHKLMHGASIITRAPDGTDSANMERWLRYLAAEDLQQVEHGISELLMRIERIRFEPFFLVEPSGIPERGSAGSDSTSFANIATICDYIANNFRHDIDCADIAQSADIHPKYAMSVFKRSTGMTLNEYVNLLRLSYAQAMLIRDEANILEIALDSGFGSLSNFNKAFRRMSGMSPSDFRRDSRSVPEGLASRIAS
jgi:AraC-like DNA-binding protein